MMPEEKAILPKARSVKSNSLSVSLAALWILVVASCTTTTVAPVETPTAEKEDAVEAARTSVTIGESRQGRPLIAHVFGDGPDTSLLLSTIHGDEYAGTPLLERLGEHLAAQPEWLAGRRVILLPVANPDGYEHRTRYNASGVDLNRNFPAENFRRKARYGEAPLSEPEAYALHELILEYEPARVVSIHQPVRVIDWDGPADGLAAAMSEACGLKAKRIGSRPGSLGSWFGEKLGRAIITLELPPNVEKLSTDELWDRYGDALLAFVTWADE